MSSPCDSPQPAQLTKYSRHLAPSRCLGLQPGMPALSSRCLQQGQGWILTQTHRGGRRGGERCQGRIWPRRAKQLSVVLPALFVSSSRTSPVPAPRLLPPAKCESPTWSSRDAQLSSWSSGRSLCLLLSLSSPTERLMEVLGLAGLVRTDCIHPARAIMGKLPGNFSSSPIVRSSCRVG